MRLSSAFTILYTLKIQLPLILLSSFGNISISANMVRKKKRFLVELVSHFRTSSMSSLLSGKRKKKKTFRLTTTLTTLNTVAVLWTLLWAFKRKVPSVSVFPSTMFYSKLQDLYLEDIVMFIKCNHAADTQWASYFCHIFLMVLHHGGFDWCTLREIIWLHQLIHQFNSIGLEN